MRLSARPEAIIKNRKKIVFWNSFAETAATELNSLFIYYYYYFLFFQSFLIYVSAQMRPEAAIKNKKKNK